MAMPASSAAATQRSESSAKRRQHALELVQEVGAAVVAELDPTRVLRLIAQRARGLVGADGAVIALKDDIGDDFVIRVAAGGKAGALEGMKFAHEGSVSGIVHTVCGSRAIVSRMREAWPDVEPTGSATVA